MDTAAVVDKPADVPEHGSGAAFGRAFVRLPEAIFLEEPTQWNVMVAVDFHVYNPTSKIN